MNLIDLIPTKLHQLKVGDKFVFQPDNADFAFTVTKIKNMLVHYRPDFTGSSNHTRYLPELSNEIVYIIKPHEPKAKESN